MSYEKNDTAESDVIIFHGRKFPQRLRFNRPNGQIWIFAEHEPPYRGASNEWQGVANNSFNWTMTYNKLNTDIHLPYGEIRKIRTKADSDYTRAFKRKTKTALLIMSHCNSPSNRMEYINILRRFIDVDVLGGCGTKWECGRHLVHDDCFQIMNKYKFYLAFENSFCQNYFTEKVFENFNYDTIMVTRGGKNGEANKLLPTGTFISTDNFNNASELGMYLKNMTTETYINMLIHKDEYFSIGYQSMFHSAMCEICRRLNNIGTYTKEIHDIYNLMYDSNLCNPVRQDLN